MNRPCVHVTSVAGALVAACLLGACASTTKGGSPLASSTPSVSTGATTSGITMAPPHIVCQEGAVNQNYDGANTHPVELCLRTGAVAHLTITPPSGSTWALPTIAPSGIVTYRSGRSGSAVTVTATASRMGTVTVAVPHAGWELKIAVVA